VKRLPIITFLLLLVFSVTETRAQQQGIVKIGVFTDCQYCNCPAHEIRQYRLSLAKLDSCIDVFNSMPLDAVFHLGDMIDHGYENYDSILPMSPKISSGLLQDKEGTPLLGAEDIVYLNGV
jgi:hypothetical protein